MKAIPPRRYGAGMLDTTQPALAFLAIVVPGFLAMGGYRAGRAVPEHPEGLATTARVITVSVFIAVISWRLGGSELYRHAQAGTALTGEQASTYRFILAILLLPPLAGFLLAQVIDGATVHVSEMRERLPPAPGDEDARETLAKRLERWLLMSFSTRLLHEGPTTWDRTWTQVRRAQPYVFTRITTRGGREVIGTVAGHSRIAASPQPHDVYLEQVWREGDDGEYHPIADGLGAFVAGSKIEKVEWIAEQGVAANAQ